MKKNIAALFLIFSLLFSSLFSFPAYAEYSGGGSAQNIEMVLHENDAFLCDAEEKPDEGICGEGISWKLDTDGNLTVEGEGHITSGWKNDARIKSVVISDGISLICESAFEGCFNIRTISMPESVYDIGKRAFYGCASLENIVLSSNITSIGQGAFCGCANMKSLNIPRIAIIQPETMMDCISLEEVTIDKNTAAIDNFAFKNCISLKSINIPENMSWISSDAFNGCRALESITADENNAWFMSTDGILFSRSGTDKTGLVKYPASRAGDKYAIDTADIAPNAFRDCRVLTEVSFTADNVSIGSEAFRGASLKRINLGENISLIGTHAFAECEFLEEAVLDNLNKSIENISVGMLYQCTSLKEITIPENIKTIYQFAFSGCSALSRISLPDSLEKISSSAFENCTSLAGADIPANVSVIEDNVFSGCTNMKYINAAAGNYSSEDGVLFNADKTKIVRYPPKKDGSEYTVPASVETIGAAAFEGSLLKNVKFAGFSLRFVEDEAFCRCKELETIKFPKGTVKSVGSRAFMDCTSLKWADFPNSVENIGDSVFDGCLKLEYFDVPSKTSHIGNTVFYNCPALYEIRVTEGNKYYMSENGVLFNKKQTELIQYPADKLENEYVIPDKVTTIAWYAFYRCTELEVVFIPKKVTSIGYQAFGRCAKLSDIYVDEDNKNYSDIEGVLFDKEGLELIQYPSGRSDEPDYEIPDGTVSIYPYAFYNAQPEKITFPETLRSIGVGAFYRCRQLQTLVLSGNVEKIGAEAFFCCDNLTRITYRGTADKWGQIVKNINTNNRDIICSDGVIEAEELAGKIVSFSGGEILFGRKNGKITVSADAGCRVYAALYDDDGLFIRAYVFEADDSVYEHSIDTAGNIELMIWDKNMTPLAEKIPLL